MAIGGNAIWWRSAPWKGQRHRLRLALRAAQCNRCAICNGRFRRALPTFEHVTPVHAGGRHHRNLVLTHLTCNRLRADAAPTGCLKVWLEAVNARLAA